MADQHNGATARSAFFMVLPPEVRDAILTAAFGGRTMHVQRCNPAALQPQGQGSRSRGARGSARQWLGELFTSIKSKGKKEEEPPAERGRRWYACICEHLEGSTGDTSPTSDRCLFELQESQGPRSRYWSCTLPDDVPPELTIGAMGWLLTCRQAYNEGVKVLYATNTFHVRSNDLLTFGGFIPQIPETGLSYITSIELVLDRDLLSRKELSALPKSDVFTSEADMFEDTLSRIPRLMPRLQNLYLGFGRHTCISKDCASGDKLTYECSKYLICLVETTVREFHQAGRSCELELGLPWTLFERYRDEASRQSSEVKVGTQHWKPGMKSNYSKFSRFRVFFHIPDEQLDPDSESGARTGTDVGYWMSMSAFDLEYHMISCFGT